jgi:hypothetical protein
MKSVESLDHAALVDIVKTLQAWLYLGETAAADGETITEVWDPENEWSPADVCEFMAGKLSEHKLVPEFLGDEPREPVSKCEICGGPNH